jgi:hypothetical protein
VSAFFSENWPWLSAAPTRKSFLKTSVKVGSSGSGDFAAAQLIDKQSKGMTK